MSQTSSICRPDRHVGITAIIIHSIVDFNLHIPANAILFTVLAALVQPISPAESEYN